MVVNELRVKQGKAEAEDSADTRNLAGSVLRDGFVLAGSSQWVAPVSMGDLCLPERCMERRQGAGPEPLHIHRPLQPETAWRRVCRVHTHNTPPPCQLRLLVCVHSGPGYWWSGPGSSSSFIEQRDSEAPSHRWAIKAGLSAHSADELFAAPAAHKGPCLFAIVVVLAFLCEETKFVCADDAAASCATRRRLRGDSAAAHFKRLPCGGRIGINHRAEAQIKGSVAAPTTMWPGVLGTISNPQDFISTQWRLLLAPY